MKKNKPVSKLSYLHPRYWLLLSSFGILRLISLLPFTLVLKFGRFLGLIIMRLNKRRVIVADTNIRLCFPELSTQERAETVRKHFASLGMGLFEMALTWWGSDKRVARIPCRIEGAENLQQALAQGRGVILLSSHFTTMDIGVRLLIVNLRPPVYMTFRAHNDPILDDLVTANRVRHGEGATDHTDARSMIRALRKNKVMWYAPDQGYRGKMAEYVPFFGIPVSTHTATSRMAKISGAPVVRFFACREADNKSYKLVLYPPLENFPTDDVKADITRCNKLLEEDIRLAPEQYLWVHRRFKHLPKGEKDVYAK